MKSKPEEKEPVKITIQDKDGKTIRDIQCPAHKDDAAAAAPPRRFGAIPCEAKAGVNRTNWDLRYSPSAEPTPQQLQGMAAGFGFGPRGPLVEPGEYTIKITAGTNEVTQTVQVNDDPRITVSSEARAARHEAVMKLYGLAKTADRDRRTITSLKSNLTAAMEAWKKPGAPKIPEDVQKVAEALAKQVGEMDANYVAPEQGLGNAGPPLVYTPPPLPQRVGRLMGAIEGYTAAPTSQQAEELETITTLVAKDHDGVKKIVGEQLPALNKMMNEAGIPYISTESEGGERRGPRP